jgi:hypothetical protein
MGNQWGYCYKNIHGWHGPYSFSSSPSPSTYTLRTMRTYTCNTYSGWPYSHPTFTGYIPSDRFPAHLYYICSPDPRLASSMPLPSYWYPSYYILNPIPYYWSMTLSPLILTALPVGDSVPCYHYHSFSLWLSPPSTFTLPPVSDSVPFLPAYLCTTTYSLVCAQFPTYINPVYHSCIP